MTSNANKFTIFEPQVQTSKEIVGLFCSTENPTRWVTLIAQMQSGKTGTYILTVFEMIRLGKVGQAVIVCGTSDIALKNQVLGDLNLFVKKYAMYLADETGDDEMTRVTMAESIREKIQVIWGTQLQSATKTANRTKSIKGEGKKIPVTAEKTLFVWEESHYAQSDGNQMDSFLTSLGISPNGEGLSKTNTYFLSVSATPMSECSDIVHLKQSKGIVSLRTSDAYYGVKEMLKHNKIIGYNVDNFKETLEQAITELVIPSETKCYGLIRISGSSRETAVKKPKTDKKDKKVKVDKSASVHMKQICSVATKMGWIVKLCDSSKESTINISDLSEPPTLANTIVVIKGKCRMGEVVDKTHVLFGMETSANANTDTILQSLIGRCCGYKPNKSTVLYIPDKITKNGELERYVDFISGVQRDQKIKVLPKNAKNLVKSSIKNLTKLTPIIPLKVTGLKVFEDLGSEWSNYRDYKKTRCDQDFSNDDVKKDVVKAFRNNIGIENHNAHEIYERINEQMIKSGSSKDTDDSCKISVKVINKDKKSYKRVPKNLRTALDTMTPRTLGSSNFITIWVFGDNHYSSDGFRKYDVFVDSPVPEEDNLTPEEKEIKKKIPKTTNREIFRHTLPTKEEIYVNGAMLLGLHPDTLFDVELMKKALSNLVEHSLNLTEAETDGLVYHRRINSVINQTSENAGIWMTTEIYNEIVFGGEIYNELLLNYGVILKVIHDPNPSSSIDIVELVKLLEISW
jgi:hypothetical protein